MIEKIAEILRVSSEDCSESYEGECPAWEDGYFSITKCRLCRATQIHQAYDKDGWVQLDPDQSRSENPYPVSIFPDRDVEPAVEALQAAGIVPDSVFGNWGRIVWNNCLEKVEEQGFRRVRAPKEVEDVSTRT